jgi:polar amino acid transport system substrate-binding protein
MRPDTSLPCQRGWRLLFTLAAAALLGACAAPGAAPPTTAAAADLAPTGTLRAAINFGNPILATRDAASGEPRGVSVDLAREAAKRLGLPIELVTFTSAGQVVEAVKARSVDLAFVAIDPVRAADTEYTAPYVIIEGAYLVRQNSPIRSNAEVDRAGHRIAVGRGSAYDLYLRRELKAATLVQAPTSPAVTAPCLCCPTSSNCSPPPATPTSASRPSTTAPMPCTSAARPLARAPARATTSATSSA